MYNVLLIKIVSFIIDNTITIVYDKSHMQNLQKGIMDKVTVSQQQNHEFEPHTCHKYDSLYDTSTCWFQEAELRVI